MNTESISKPPIEGMKLIPMGLPLMFEAWFSCVLWCSSEADFRKQFESDTGLKLSALVGRSHFDKMIDNATGFEREVLAGFCDYVTAQIWGEEGAPL